MRVGKKAVGVVGVRPGRQRDSRRAVAIRGVVHLREAVVGHEDVVVVGLRLDVLHVEAGVQVLGDVPLHVEREILRLFLVVEDAGFVAHVRAGDAGSTAARFAAVHERQSRHRRTVVDVRGVGSFVEARLVGRLTDDTRLEHAVVGKREVAGDGPPGRRAERRPHWRAESCARRPADVGAALDPRILVFRVNAGQRQQQVLGVVLVLQRQRRAGARAVVVDLREVDLAGRIAPARAAVRIVVAHDVAVGIEHWHSGMRRQPAGSPSRTWRCASC